VNGGAVVSVAGVAVEVAGAAVAVADTALGGAEDVAPVDVAQPVRNNTNALARRTVASFTVTPCSRVTLDDPAQESRTASGYPCAVACFRTR
jgi:hypothetical protein